MAKASSPERSTAMRKVSIIGGMTNITLSVAQIVIGWIGNSQALIADGLHTLSDLISDVMVFVAAKYSNLRADANHPYGHARIETATTVAIGILLMLVAGGVMADAARRLLNPTLLLQPGALALAATTATILAKEALYRYTLHMADRLRSQMLRASAWHHRSDAISSVIVLIGVAGSMMGIPALDALAALGVGVMIAHIGWSLSGQALSELVDTGLAPEKIERIREVILAVHGVRELHLLRTRRMADSALVDVHILVDPALSVSEGHQISETARWRLLDADLEITDVTVHIDPEDDSTSAPNSGLPLRDKVLRDLGNAWESVPEAKQIQQVTLHYLAGKIAVEIRLPLHCAESPQQSRELASRFSELAAPIGYIRRVAVYFA
jgi:cation diffusion facilitator family transporter